MGLSELKRELTIAEAAEALGVSRDTVDKYLRDGLLVARNAAPLSSRRRMIRIPWDAVLLLRNGYESQKTDSAARPAKADRVRPYVCKIAKMKPR